MLDAPCSLLPAPCSLLPARHSPLLPPLAALALAALAALAAATARLPVHRSSPRVWLVRERAHVSTVNQSWTLTGTWNTFRRPRNFDTPNQHATSAGAVRIELTYLYGLNNQFSDDP